VHMLLMISWNFDNCFMYLQLSIKGWFPNIFLVPLQNENEFVLFDFLKVVCRIISTIISSTDHRGVFSDLNAC
jgi:hypothetical protein